MAMNDQKKSNIAEEASRLDPKSLSMIEQIFYYENLQTLAADNDNASRPSETKDSACFDSWAIPEHMRK